jgi:hypothetical protein
MTPPLTMTPALEDKPGGLADQEELRFSFN